MSRLGLIARQQSAARKAATAGGYCHYCTGQGFVFGGVPGQPQITDVENMQPCPRCDGTGKPRPEQGKLI